MHRESFQLLVQGHMVHGPRLQSRFPHLRACADSVDRSQASPPILLFSSSHRENAAYAHLRSILAGGVRHPIVNAFTVSCRTDWVLSKPKCLKGPRDARVSATTGEIKIIGFPYLFPEMFIVRKEVLRRRTDERSVHTGTLSYVTL